MLPSYPDSEMPSREPPAPSPPVIPVFVTYVIYHLSGVTAGSIAGMCVGGFGCAFLAWEAPTVRPLVALVFFGFVGGFFGFPCGHLFWIVASLWPAARHSIRAASLGASLCGTMHLLLVFLLLLSGRIANIEAEHLIALGVILVAGAFFGFATTWLTRFLEGTYVWVIARV